MQTDGWKMGQTMDTGQIDNGRMARQMATKHNASHHLLFVAETYKNITYFNGKDE